MILTLFAQLAYVNVLHWIVRLYYYGFLVNEGICLILVIQIFYPSALSVLYNKDVYQTLQLYDLLVYRLLYLNYTRFFKTLSYCSKNLCFFALLILWFIYIYVHFYVFM